MDILIKAKYSCVHVDNYQGGSGRVILNEQIFKINENMAYSKALENVKEYFNNVDTGKHYKIESYIILSIEVINSVDLTDKGVQNNE